MEVPREERESSDSSALNRPDASASVLPNRIPYLKKNILLLFGGIASVAWIASFLIGEPSIDLTEFSTLERREKLAGLVALELESRDSVALLVIAMNDADEEVGLAAYRKLSRLQNRWFVEPPSVRNRYQRELNQQISSVGPRMEPTQRAWARTLVQDSTSESRNDLLLGTKVDLRGQKASDHSQTQPSVTMHQPAIVNDLAAQPIPADFSVSLETAVVTGNDIDADMTDQIDDASDVGHLLLPIEKSPRLKSVKQEPFLASGRRGVASPQDQRSGQRDRSEGGVVLAGAMLPADKSHDDVVNTALDRRLQESTKRTSLASFDDATVVQWLVSDHAGFQQLARKELRYRGYREQEVKAAEQYFLGSLDERLATVHWVATSAEASLELWLPLFFRSNSREFKLAAASILANANQDKITRWLFKQADSEPDMKVAERMRLVDAEADAW